MLTIIAIVKGFLDSLLLGNFSCACCSSSTFARLCRFALYTLALALNLGSKALKRRR